MVNEGRRTMRPGINLEMMGIRLGDTLALVDRLEETCVVVALYPPRVAHCDEVKSLTEAYRVQYNDPAAVWVYSGETLRQRRERFETYHSG